MVHSEQDALRGAVTYAGPVAASHVGYELVQLAAMPSWHQKADHDGEDRPAIACLESMLLHARNLIDFLMKGGPDTDIRRSDFMAKKWSPPNKPPKVRLAKKRLDDARPRLDRDLSHITWARVEGAAPVYDLARIAHDVVEVMGTFVEHLATEASPAAEWFDDDLRRAHDLLKEAPRSVTSRTQPAAQLSAWL